MCANSDDLLLSSIRGCWLYKSLLCHVDYTKGFFNITCNDYWRKTCDKVKYVPAISPTLPMAVGEEAAAAVADVLCDTPGGDGRTAGKRWGNWAWCKPGLASSDGGRGRGGGGGRGGLVAAAATAAVGEECGNDGVGPTTPGGMEETTRPALPLEGSLWL